VNTPHIGIDVTEIARFRPFVHDRRHSFLRKVFSERELVYCFSYKNPAVHLAGIFAAKEAVAKALDARRIAFIELEITHTKSGAPEVRRKNRKLSVAVSITHTHSLAAAVAVMYHTSHARKEKMPRPRS